MSIGLIGKKAGMSRLFLEDGAAIPVTAISVCGNFLADIKTSQRDGYNAFVVSKVTKSNNVNKSKSEFFKKINLTPGILAEFRSDKEISDEFKVKMEIVLLNILKKFTVNIKIKIKKLLSLTVNL